MGSPPSGAVSAEAAKAHEASIASVSQPRSPGRDSPVNHENNKPPKIGPFTIVKPHVIEIELIRQGRMTPDEANAIFGHLLNYALAEGGLIDYVTNKDAALVADARFARVIREVIGLTRQAIADFENVYELHCNAGRRTGSVRGQPGGMGSLSEKGGGEI
jgi:hypothetical protein